jgi:hypothetical protein
MEIFELPKNFKPSKNNLQSMQIVMADYLYNYAIDQFTEVIQMGFTTDNYFYITFLYSGDVSISCGDGRTLEYIFVDDSGKEHIFMSMYDLLNWQDSNGY